VENRVFTDQLIIALVFLDIVIVAGYFWLDRKNHHPHQGE